MNEFENEELLFLSQGDQINVTFNKTDSSIKPILNWNILK